MRKLRLFIASSLDGHIAREDGGTDWLFLGGDYGYRKFYRSIDAVIMGRKTWEVAKSFESEPFKGKKIYVFSKKHRTKGNGNAKGGGAKFVSKPAEFTRKLLRERGGDVWIVGGSEIISVLMNARIIDEIIVSIHPIVLGKGIPLFSRIKNDVKLKLTKSIKYKNGLVQLHYNVEK